MTADDEAGPVRPGDELDAPALEHFLRRHLDLPDRPLEVRQFVAGRANLTFLVEVGDVHVVVRRPPKGTIAPGAHDMAREAKVLGRLEGHYPRAPRALAFCDDPAVLGAPFVVIERRRGVVVRDSVPDVMVGLPDVARRLDLALVDAAADLHTVDVDAAGLANLGRPDGFGSRQVSGWTDRWHRAARDTSLPVMDEVAARLAASVPEPARVSIVHNDLKLDNCQFAADDPDTVTSVFDWDMATLGDPLFDLGLMITAMDASAVWVVSTDEAVSRYAARTGIAVDRIDWYVAFATWRMAVVLQQLYGRYASGDTSDERLAGFGAHVPVLANQSWELLDR